MSSFHAVSFCVSSLISQIPSSAPFSKIYSFENAVHFHCNTMILLKWASLQKFPRNCSSQHLLFFSKLISSSSPLLSPLTYPVQQSHQQVTSQQTTLILVSPLRSLGSSPSYTWSSGTFPTNFVLSLKVKVLVSRLCPSLGNPMDCNPKDSSVHGIFQEYWSVLSCPPPGNLLDPHLPHCKQFLYHLSH